MTLVADMYALANAGDYDGFMSAIFLLSLYALLIGFSALDFINERH